MKSAITKFRQVLIEKLIYDLYELKYNKYTKTNKIINHNNEIIYKFIKSLLHNLYLVNDNYEIIREIIIYNCLKNKDISYNEQNKQEAVIDIIDNILKSFYNKNFNGIKHKLINKIPIRITNKITNDTFVNKLIKYVPITYGTFINQVKKNKYIIKKKNKSIGRIK